MSDNRKEMLFLALEIAAKAVIVFALLVLAVEVYVWMKGTV